MAAWNPQQERAALGVRAGRFGSTVVLDLDGRLTIGSSGCRLMRLVRCLARRGDTNLVLDLDHVPQLDCTGIGQLVFMRNRLVRHGRTLALVNVERHQRWLLELVGLQRVLPVFDSRPKAVAWCELVSGRTPAPRSVTSRLLASAGPRSA